MFTPPPPPGCRAHPVDLILDLCCVMPMGGSLLAHRHQHAISVTSTPPPRAHAPSTLRHTRLCCVVAVLVQAGCPSPLANSPLTPTDARGAPPPQKQKYPPPHRAGAISVASPKCESSPHTQTRVAYPCGSSPPLPPRTGVASPQHPPTGRRSPPPRRYTHLCCVVPMRAQSHGPSPLPAGQGHGAAAPADLQQRATQAQRQQRTVQQLAKNCL
jgi:hypothetical protein